MTVADGNVDSVYNLGYYNFTEKNYELMKKYYWMAIALNDTDSMNSLGYYYYHVEKNYGLMKKWQ